MCGEHKTQDKDTPEYEGSSPHVRGTPRRGDGRGDPFGIIPACAGNTWVEPRKAPAPRDHPRMCGEHATLSGMVASRRGSSPHVRGTHVIRGVDLVATGIIPACAGNTRNRKRIGTTHGDHPRMCGEHSGVDLATYGPQGSSPHVRGTPRRLRTAGRMGGIIPACAGNTGCSIGALIGRWDHPRMCGEHRVPVDDETVGEGSSPHVRGTHVR